MKYYIPEFNLSKLKKLVERLAKKTEVKFSYNENDIKQERILVADGVYAPYNTIAVELEIDYKVGDYEIVAELEHHTDGNIIRTINTKYEVPNSYRTCKPNCEHCNKLRTRANTFLLVDKENNFKQVGKSCLNDYTGYDTIKVLSLVSSINSLINSYEYDEEFINEVKHCKFNELTELANKFYQLVVANGYDKTDPFKYYDKCKYKKELEPKVAEILSVINTDWYNEKSDYCFNIKILLNLQYIEYKHWRLLISYINSAIAYLQNKDINNEYLGNVKDRIEFKVKQFRILFTSDNYGYYCPYNDEVNYTYRIITETNNVVIWKTSRELENNMTIKATIKELKTYKEEKQTVITRGTIIKEPEPYDYTKTADYAYEQFMKYIEEA